MVVRAASLTAVTRDPGRLLETLHSPSAKVKYAAAKQLCTMSQESPELVYPYFDEFVRMFEGDNTILRWGSTRILGNLARADTEARLDAMLDRYLAPIAGKEMIGAANVMAGAAEIALAKPHLAQTVANGILRVEHARYATPECRNIAIGHAIRAFDRFLPALPDRTAVIGFVSRQLHNRRPATRNKAQRFLKRWAAA